MTRFALPFAFELPRATSPLAWPLLVAGALALIAVPLFAAEHASVDAENARASAAALPARAMPSKARRVVLHGIVEGVRHVARRVDAAEAFEITVRLRDGSTRMSSDATETTWQAGDRIMLIGGLASPA